MHLVFLTMANRMEGCGLLAPNRTGRRSVPLETGRASPQASGGSSALRRRYAWTHLRHARSTGLVINCLILLPLFGYLATPTGFEPATPRLGIWCSIHLSY